MRGFLNVYFAVFALCLLVPNPDARAINCSYFMEKVVEAVTRPHIILAPKNLMLASFVGSLMVTTKERAFIQVPLRFLNTIHTIDTSQAQKKMAERAEILLTHFPEIESEGVLSVALQNKLIPSVYPIMAVQDKLGNFVVFDGNGRLGSIHQAFQGRVPDLPVEIQLFDTKGAWLPNYLVHKVMLAHGFQIPRLEIAVPFVELSRTRVSPISLMGEMMGLYK